MLRLGEGARCRSRFLLAAFLGASGTLSAQATRLIPEEGYTRTGAPTPAWTAALAGLRGPGTPPALPAPRPLTAAEEAWAVQLRSGAVRWVEEVPGLLAPFAPLEAPAGVRILLGFQGGEDAFSPDDRTLAFDVSRLAALYGEASLPENGARLDRFFRHEYTHVLQKAWLSTHPYPTDTPLRAALLDIWKEGQGNFHSLSGRWLTPTGELSGDAQTALTTLRPRFVARLTALTAASPEHATRLRANLSMGPFDQKWGALPVALWLAEEQRLRPDALRAFVLSGPDGVWDLADRHLPEELRAVWRETRAAAQLAGAR